MAEEKEDKGIVVETTTISDVEDRPEKAGQPSDDVVRTSVKTITQPFGFKKPLILQGLVSQPTAMPTNKWLLYTGGILFGMVIEAVMTYFVPNILPPEFWKLFPYFLGGIVAYIMKDQKNS